MKRQRAGNQAEQEARRLRLDGKPLSEDTARRAREIADLWMEQDAQRMARHGEYEREPDPVRPPARVCAFPDEECLAELRRDNTTGYCPEHASTMKRRALRELNDAEVADVR